MYATNHCHAGCNGNANHAYGKRDQPDVVFVQLDYLLHVVDVVEHEQHRVRPLQAAVLLTLALPAPCVPHVVPERFACYSNHAQEFIILV